MTSLGESRALRVPSRPFWMSACLLMFTPVLGIVTRFMVTALPWTVRKYGGSLLWAAMVYWAVSTAFSRVRPWNAAVAAAVLATGVEFGKLLHTPWLDAFRQTIAGVLLLGKQFGWTDLLAYSIGIACAAAYDVRLRRRFRGN